MAQRQARGAHNSEDLGSKPSAGILVLSKLIAWFGHFLNRHGAEAARGAHNSEDLGSKPSVGILVFIQVHSLIMTSLTGVAQG